MLYFGLGDADLRDLYSGSAWITFAKQITQTTFTREDVVVLSEDLVKSRTEMLQAIHHIRGFGARVLYVGWSGNESDAWKRQLAFLGVYDWLFVEAEINLEHIDRLLSHPRSPKDVERYLEDLHLQPAPTLAVVSVYMEDDEPVEPVEALTQTLQNLAGTEEEAERSVLERVSGHFGSVARSVRETMRRRRGESIDEPVVALETAPKAKRFVWSVPRPVTVRLMGDPGVGKSFIAWNLAALCDRNELPAAVIERDSPIFHWGDALGVHVMTDVPKRGYRVHIVTGPLHTQAADGDVLVAVTWPDPARSEKAALTLWQGEEDREVWWIVNHGDDEGMLPDGIPLSDRVLVVPYEARQAGAIRMKTPLALSDPRFAVRLLPLVEHIKARFADKARSPGKEEDVDVAFA